MKIICRAGGVTREIEVRKVAVLVKFLKCAVFKDVTSIPNLASLLVSTLICDVPGPLVTTDVIFVEVLV